MEQQDLLGFAHLMSGINLAEYVINYIDQHLIAYGMIGNINHSIHASKENESTVIYSLDNLSDEEINTLNSLKDTFNNNHELNVYDTIYYITMSDQPNGTYILRIQQCN